MSIINEVAITPAISAIMQGIPIYISIALQYGRTKQVTYVRDTLQAAILNVIEQDDLILETDPRNVRLVSSHWHPLISILDLSSED